MKRERKMAPDVIKCVVLLLFCVIGNAQGYSDVPPLKNYNLNDSAEATHIKRILAFGDSLTEGYLSGGRKFYPYTTKLEEKLNSYFNWTRFEVLNEGVSGECAYTEMVTRLPKVLQRVARRVSLVIILAGSNDFHKLDCVKRVNVAHEVIMLHKLVHKAGLKSVLVTIPECMKINKTCDKARQKVNHKLRGWAMEHKNSTLLCDLAKFLPMYNMSSFDRKVFWDDDVHPSKIGYDKIAAILFHTIRAQLMPLVYNSSTLASLNITTPAPATISLHQYKKPNDTLNATNAVNTTSQKKVKSLHTTHAHKTNTTKQLKMKQHSRETNTSKSKQIGKGVLNDYTAESHNQMTSRAARVASKQTAATMHVSTHSAPAPPKHLQQYTESTDGSSSSDRVSSKHLKQSTEPKDISRVSSSGRVPSTHAKKYKESRRGARVSGTGRVPYKHLYPVSTHKSKSSSGRLPSTHLNHLPSTTQLYQYTGYTGGAAPPVSGRLPKKHLKKYSESTHGSSFTSGGKQYKHYGEASHALPAMYSGTGRLSHPGSTSYPSVADSTANAGAPSKHLPHYTETSTGGRLSNAGLSSVHNALKLYPLSSRYPRPSPVASTDLNQYYASTNSSKPSISTLSNPAATSYSPASQPAAGTTVASTDIHRYSASTNDSKPSINPLSNPAVTSYSPATNTAAAPAAPAAASPSQPATGQLPSTNSSGVVSVAKPPVRPFTFSTATIDFPAAPPNATATNYTQTASPSPSFKQATSPVIPVANSNVYAHAPYASGNSTQINTPRLTARDGTTTDGDALQKEFQNGPFTSETYTGNTQ